MNGSRLGLIARCDHRGLGIQTRAYYQHLQPVKTLAVLMRNAAGNWTPYREFATEWYPDACTAPFDGERGCLPDAAIRWLLDGVDAVLTAEAFYDPRVTEWARAAGVATIVVANPEFATPEKMGSADLVVNPSLWRADQLPGIHLSHPVDREHLPYRRRPLSGGPLRFLHVAGHRAMHDRAGTDLVVDAYRRMRNPVDLTIRTQSPLSGPTEMLMRQCPQGPPTVLRGDVEDYTTLYDGYDVLVAPRRFGGLSLPLNEAAACGLAIVATDREPERFALPPESLVPVRETRMVRCQAGPLAVESCDATELAMRLDALVEDRETLGRLSEASDAYAASIAWATLLPAWELLLDSMPQRLATAGVA